MKAAAFRSGHAIHWRSAFLCFGFWLVTMASPQAGCFAGGSDRLIVELLFGRNIENRGTVSNQAFQGFLDSEVTPRFPGGFTVLDTQGQYRATGSRIIV